jgi:hypothetical protein
MNPASKALRYIESHLACELTLDDVAAIGGVSRFHMVRAFSAATGLSVIRYVRAPSRPTTARGLPSRDQNCSRPETSSRQRTVPQGRAAQLHLLRLGLPKNYTKQLSLFFSKWQDLPRGQGNCERRVNLTYCKISTFCQSADRLESM